MIMKFVYDERISLKCFFIVNVAGTLFDAQLLLSGKEVHFIIALMFCALFIWRLHTVVSSPSTKHRKKDVLLLILKVRGAYTRR